MRLIDADVHECWACVHNNCGCDTWCDYGELFELREDVKNAPTIEAVPVVHAEWKMRGGKLYCTNCGKKALAEKDRDDWYGCERSNFCPHCGADMRKKV